MLRRWRQEGGGAPTGGLRKGIVVPRLRGQPLVHQHAVQPVLRGSRRLPVRTHRSHAAARSATLGGPAQKQRAHRPSTNIALPLPSDLGIGLRPARHRVRPTAAGIIAEARLFTDRLCGTQLKACVSQAAKDAPAAAGAVAGREGLRADDRPCGRRRQLRTHHRAGRRTAAAPSPHRPSAPHRMRHALHEKNRGGLQDAKYEDGNTLVP